MLYCHNIYKTINFVCISDCSEIRVYLKQPNDNGFMRLECYRLKSHLTNAIQTCASYNRSTFRKTQGPVIIQSVRLWTQVKQHQEMNAPPWAQECQRWHGCRVCGVCWTKSERCSVESKKGERAIKESFFVRTCVAQRVEESGGMHWLMWVLEKKINFFLSILQQFI